MTMTRTIRVLPPNLQIIAQNEVNEKPDEVKEHIRTIREWIAQQPHLHSRTDDQWILTYLRGSKFNIEKTKQKIDYYYRLRTIAPEFFKNRDPVSPAMTEFLDKKIVLPLEVNKNGPQIFLVRLGVDDIDHIPLTTIVKSSMILYDIGLNENDYLIMGQTIIYDLKGMKLSRITELSLNQIRIICSLQSAYSMRVKNIIVINAPSAAYGIIEIIKLFLGKKIGSRLKVCTENNFEQLHKIVPLSKLPKEYGGEACLDKLIDYHKQKMVEYQEWFAKDALYGTDETKRIQRSSKLSSILNDYFGNWTRTKK